MDEFLEYFGGGCCGVIIILLLLVFIVFALIFVVSNVILILVFIIYSLFYFLPSIILPNIVTRMEILNIKYDKLFDSCKDKQLVEINTIDNKVSLNLIEKKITEISRLNRKEVLRILVINVTIYILSFIIISSILILIDRYSSYQIYVIFYTKIISFYNLDQISRSIPLTQGLTLSFFISLIFLFLTNYYFLKRDYFIKDLNKKFDTLKYSLENNIYNNREFILKIKKINELSSFFGIEYKFDYMSDIIIFLDGDIKSLLNEENTDNLIKRIYKKLNEEEENFKQSYQLYKSLETRYIKIKDEVFSMGYTIFFDELEAIKINLESDYFLKKISDKKWDKFNEGVKFLNGELDKLEHLIKEFQKTGKYDDSEIDDEKGDMSIENAFEVFGLDKNATYEDFKSVRKELLYKFHYDKSQAKSEGAKRRLNEETKKIYDAWEIIKEYFGKK